MTYWNVDNLGSIDRQLWTRFGTAHSDAYYTFGGDVFALKKEADKGFRYAPITNGSLYVKVPATDNDRVKLLGSNQRRDVYVSFSVLFWMASDDFFSRSQDLYNQGDPVAALGRPNDTGFTDRLVAQPPPSCLQFLGKKIKFPVRYSNGTAGWAYLIGQDSLSAWDKFCDKLIPEGHAGKGKPPRHANLRLDHNLKVMLLATRGSLLRERISDNEEKIYSWFNALINTVNQANQGQGWTLELTRIKPAGYIEIAKDPFDIYSTWIHQEDWNKYMSRLGIRPFPSKDAEVLSSLLKKLAERSYVLLANRPAEELMFDFDMDPADVRRICKARAEIVTRGREMSKENQEKVYASMLAMGRQASMNGPGKLKSFLDARKIDAAVGKRTEERGQAAVMGNYSATDIAAGFDWPTNKLDTGFAAAEWLHLSAYSWGGFEDSGPYLTSSSQSPENLVFGTSETNSLMTRYEIAWQRLLREEQEMLECGQAYSLGIAKFAKATLDISINDPDSPVRYDELSPEGNFTLPDFRFTENEICYVKENPSASLADFADDNSPAITQGPGVVTTTQRRMLRLAHYYPWLAYSIAYSVQLETSSYILGTDGPSRTLHHFYPFQRPFFHTAESELDDLVWHSLTDFGWMKICKLINEDHPDIEINPDSIEGYREQIWNEDVKKQVKLGNSPVSSRNLLKQKIKKGGPGTKTTGNKKTGGLFTKKSKKGSKKKGYTVVTEVEIVDVMVESDIEG